MSASEWEPKPDTPRVEIEAAWTRLQQLGQNLDAYHRGVAAALSWLLGTGPLPFAEQFLHNPPTDPDNPGQRARVGVTVADVYYDATAEPEVRQYALGAENVINGVVNGADRLPPYNF